MIQRILRLGAKIMTTYIPDDIIKELNVNDLKIKEFFRIKIGE